MASAQLVMKCTLICKPEQSGKTGLMTLMIKDWKCNPIPGIKTINFICCDNSLLLTGQTCNRVSTDMSMFKINDSDEICIELSSNKIRTKYNNHRDVLVAITFKHVTNIICCSNHMRQEDISTIIHMLNDCYNGQYKFNIFLDEADKFLPFIKKTILPLTNTFDNVDGFLITATPKPLFDLYKFMDVHPLEDTVSVDYHGWDDNIKTLVDLDTSDPVAFLQHVLDHIAPTLLPGDKIFAPASTTILSHSLAKKAFNERRCACLVVNGDGIELTLPNLVMYSYDKSIELNLLLPKIYAEHRLHQWPFAVTGNLCISRGISHMSPDFIFDYGILNTMNNPSTASQMAGRLKGNIKPFPNYKPPHVFTTKAFDKISSESEKRSRQLAKLAWDKKVNGESTVITKTEFKTCSTPFTYKIVEQLFDTFASALTYLNQPHIARQMANGTTPVLHMHTPENTPIKRRFHTPGVDEPNGYAVSTKITKKNESTQADRITYDKAIHRHSPGFISEGSCISSTNTGSRYLILPIYENMDTPPTQEKYQVRHIIFNAL